MLLAIPTNCRTGSEPADTLASSGAHGRTKDDRDAFDIQPIVGEKGKLTKESEEVDEETEVEWREELEQDLCRTDTGGEWHHQGTRFWLSAEGQKGREERFIQDGLREVSDVPLDQTSEVVDGLIGDRQ